MGLPDRRHDRARTHSDVPGRLVLAPRHGLIARWRLQTLAAGSSSAALGLIAAGLSNIGLRGLADRLVTTRVEWVTPRLVKLTAASVALAILVAVVSLAGPDAPA